MTKAEKRKLERKRERLANAQAISPMAAGVIPGCSCEHVHDLITEGQIRALDLAGSNNKSARHNYRIPLTAPHEFIEKRSTIPAPVVGTRSTASLNRILQR